MIITPKTLQKVIFVSIIFVIFSCTEEEIIGPLPKQGTLGFLKFIESHSVQDLETVSIFQNIVEVDFRAPLDSLISNDTSSYKYKVSLHNVILRGTENKVITGKLKSSNSLIVELGKLNPNTAYSLQFNFQLINEISKTVNFSETIRFNSYELPKFYNDGKIKTLMRGENKLMPYDLLRFEPIIPLGAVITSQDHEYKSNLKIQIWKNGLNVDVDQLSTEKYLYSYEKDNYLFTPGKYKYQAKEVFYEKISGEWKQVETIIKEEDFEVISVQESYIKEQSPIGGGKIDRNEPFKFVLKKIESISSEIIDVKIVLDSAVLENQSGFNYNLQIYNEDVSYRMVPSEILGVNESVSLKCYLKYILSNDTINYKYPEIIETESRAFTVSDKIGAPVRQFDILASYPIARQRNFFIDEFNKGVFKINSINYLEKYFNESIEYKILFIESNDTLSTNAKFRNQDLTLKFDLPSNLKLNTIYNYQIYDKTNSQIVFYDYFKTSRYTTFSEKIDNLRTSSGAENYSNSGPLPGGRRIFISMYPDEIFDFVDFDFKMGKNNGLISVTGVLSNTDWYTNNVYQELYSNLNELPFQIDWRDEYEFNKIPDNAFECASNNIKLSSEEIETGVLRNFDKSTKSKTIICNYERVFKGDFNQLVSLAQDYSGEQNDYVDLILESGFKSLSKGLYPTEIKYTIPVYNEVTFSETWSFWKQF